MPAKAANLRPVSGDTTFLVQDPLCRWQARHRAPATCTSLHGLDKHNMST